MPRPRKTNPHGLPARVYRRGKWFSYLDRNNHWHKLGREWNTLAKSKWVDLTASEPVSGTLSELLAEYIERFAKFRRSPRTYADHQIERKPLTAVFGHVRPQDVTQADIAEYLERRGRQANVRANREIALLSSAYSYGLRIRFPGVEHNPCYGVRRNTEHARTRHVTGRELRAFTKHCPRWLRCYVLVKYLTGLRQGDMLKLNRTTDDQTRLQVRTGKTGRVIEFRMTWALRTAIDAAKKIERPFVNTRLFTNREGNPINAHAFKSAWARAMHAYIAQGNERFREHDIRAATASSGDISTAQERLGHTSARQTQAYRRAPARVRPIR